MKPIIKKYRLNDTRQDEDDKKFWEKQSTEYKIGVLESLRNDAIQLGIYPNHHESKQRLRRVFRISKQK